MVSVLMVKPLPIPTMAIHGLPKLPSIGKTKNLSPLDGHLEAANTFRVSKDGNSFVQVTLDADVPITVGQVHTITINVEQAPTEIDLATVTESQLTVSGKTTIKGDGTTSKNLQITVEADAEVTLENV